MASPEASASYAQKLGMIYHHRQGQTYGGYTLERVGKRQGYITWVVAGPPSDKTDIGTWPPPRPAPATPRSWA